MSSMMSIPIDGIKKVYACNQDKPDVSVYFECDSEEVAAKISRKALPSILSDKLFFLDSRRPRGVTFCAGFRSNREGKPQIFVAEVLIRVIADIVSKKGAAAKNVSVETIQPRQLEEHCGLEEAGRRIKPLETKTDDSSLEKLFSTLVQNLANKRRLEEAYDFCLNEEDDSPIESREKLISKLEQNLENNPEVRDEILKLHKSYTTQLKCMDQDMMRCSSYDSAEDLKSVKQLKEKISKLSGLSLTDFLDVVATFLSKREPKLRKSTL